MTAATTLGFIGDGAMVRAIVTVLAETATDASVTPLAALDLADAPPSRSGLRRVTSLDALLALKLDLVVECAAPPAVLQYGPAILRAGCDFAVISTAAFADDACLPALRAAALAGHSRCVVPAGAVAGVEALSAARHAGIDQVTYRSRKPPAAWRGTPAEQLVDLDRLTAATVFYEGSARAAATLYPKNANVAATVALYGIGIDRTRVALVADPVATGNTHRIEASGAFGALSLEIGGPPLADNPKTARLAAMSLVQTILARTAPVVI